MERDGPMTSTPRENLSNHDVSMRTAPPGTPQAPPAAVVVAEQPINILKQAFLPPNNTVADNSNVGGGDGGDVDDGDLTSYHDSDEDGDLMDADTQLLDEEDELEENMSAFTNAETEEGRRGADHSGNAGDAGDDVSDMEN